MDELDSLDRHLLELLQIDSRQTGDQLAERIGLSRAACLRRLQRLRKIGAIEREIAVISPRFQGPVTRVIVLLTLNRDHPQRIDALTQKLRKLPEVERIFYVTGQADIAIIVRCASMEDYANFTEAHLFEPPLEGFESIIVMREYPKDFPE